MMAYDSALGKPVLFGGIAASGTPSAGHLDLQRDDLEKLTLGHQAPARTDAAMAYDSAAKRGGPLRGARLHRTNTLDDTWVFTGSSWTQLRPRHRPRRAILRPDGLRHRRPIKLVLFGGLDSNPTPLATSGPIAAGSWTAQTTTALPSARSGRLDGLRHRDSQLVLFGGLDPNVNTLGDLWTAAGPPGPG